MDNILELKNVKKTFGEKVILEDINLKIKNKEFVSIMGKSGSGKSTLINILAGQILPTFGDVFWNSQKISSLKDKEISNLRLNNIGFINQDPLLFKEMNVFENITLPLRIANKFNHKNIEKTKQYMEKFGIIDLINNKTNELSGGQIQRVSIIRALIMNPLIIIADEPTGNLDDFNRDKFLDFLKFIHNDFNLSTIIVTHDKVVADSCDTKYIINNKRLVIN